LSIAIQVESPGVPTGPENPDQVLSSSTGPATSHREVAGLPHEIKAEVYRAIIPKIIAVAIKFPQTSSWIKDTNLRCSYTTPVANNRKISLLTEGS